MSDFEDDFMAEDEDYDLEVLNSVDNV